MLTLGGRPPAGPAGPGLGRPPELAQLLEDGPAESGGAAVPDERGDPTGVLVVAGFVVGPVAGLVLGLRDRAAARSA